MKRLLIFCITIGLLAACATDLPETPAPTTQFESLYATPAASLSAIPIFVGETTFNELNNSGFSQQYVVDWTSNDLHITVDGHVSGTIITTYGGKPAPFTKFKDILFFQTQARYIYPQYGDILHQPLSQVVPLFATESSERSAKFIFDTRFQVPPLVLDSDGGLPLRNLELTLTWIRIYKGDQASYVQIFSGDADRYPDKPQISFDKKLQQPITARFGYYSILPESRLKGGHVLEPDGEFQYLAWLKENVEW